MTLMQALLLSWFTLSFGFVAGCLWRSLFLIGSNPHSAQGYVPGNIENARQPRPLIPDIARYRLPNA